MPEPSSRELVNKILYFDTSVGFKAHLFVLFKLSRTASSPEPSPGLFVSSIIVSFPIGGSTIGRSASMDIMALSIMGAFAFGALMVFICKKGIRLFKKHVLKIPEPPQNFIMEKKVKCVSGHNMMLFHVPKNVSDYIMCGSKSACDKESHQNIKL